MKAFNSSIVIVLMATAITAYAQDRAARVVVDQVTEKEIAKTNRLVGIVHFDVRSGISAEISGLIEKQNIIEGTVIKQGSIMTRLNTDFIRKTIEIVEKRVELIDIRITNMEKNLRRYEVLFKKDAASEKAYDDMSGSYNELLKEREILKKEIEKLKIEMARSNIRAPFDGLVLEKYKNEGEWLSPGSPICSLASVADLCIEAAVSEDLVRFIRSGMEVTVIINALDREYVGKVKQISRMADLRSKTLSVKIAIPYFDEAIQNMSATVNIPVSQAMKLRMIKRDALVRFNEKDFVYTVKDGVAKILPVNIVAYQGQYFGVDDPHILPGMPVVIEGNDRLRPDTPVLTQ